MTETTQDSLNVRLAKWAGYSVRYYRDFSGVEHWDLLNSAGELAPIRDDSFGLYPAHSEAEVWQHAPDYAGSLDAGMALVPKHMAVDFRATRNGIPMGFYRVSLIDWTVRGRQSWWWDAEGATRAEALAAALEAMLMAQQEAGGDARQS